MLSVAFVFLGRSYLISQYRDDMDDNADEIARTASALYQSEGLDSWELRLVISSLSASSGNHIFISDSDGVIMLCSDKTLTCPHIGQQLSNNVMNLLATNGEIDQLSNLDGFYEATQFVVAKPISSSEGLIIGYVFLSSDTSSIVGAYRTFFWVVLALFIAVALIAILLSLVFSKKLTEPLDEMAIAARKFSHGDFSTRVANESHQTDEMGTLIDAFNEMADSLESNEKRREAFIGNISHELRTPMTTIAGFADGILDGTIPPEQEAKYLTAISDETKRLSRLVRNMLDVSQVQAKITDKTRRSVFDYTELILQTLLSFETRAEEKNLDMDLQLPEDHIFVLADSDAITQVIYNLVDNAIKFASKGSSITVMIYRKAGKVYTRVKDRGETIPPDDLPYIFDRFHKSDRSRSLDKEGVGLGLYLVKTILNSHDEDITVTSQDGVTEFVFTLAEAENDTGRRESKRENKQ